MLNDTPLQRCSKCSRALPATPEYFSRRNNRPSGFNSWCKECCGSPFTSSDYKICTKCKRGFPATSEHFGAFRGGLNPRCRSCTNEYQRQWKKEHIEEEHARQKRYRELRPEYHRERMRRYRAENPDYQNNWNKKNHDKVREYRKHTHAKNLSRNRVKVQRRRARVAGLPNDLTSSQWVDCLEYFNHCCAVCGRQLRDLFGEIEPNADHWIPIASPKCTGTIATNIVCLCNKCNSNKRARDAFEWLTDNFGKRQAKAIMQRIETYFQWVRERDR